MRIYVYTVDTYLDVCMYSHKYIYIYVCVSVCVSIYIHKHMIYAHKGVPLEKTTMAFKNWRKKNVRNVVHPFCMLYPSLDRMDSPKLFMAEFIKNFLGALPRKPWLKTESAPGSTFFRMQIRWPKFEGREWYEPPPDCN